MTDSYDIDVWTPRDRDEVIAMIVSIQQGEFGLPITADDQPDLFDVAASYQEGGGQFWIAHREGEVVGTIAAIVIEENTVALRKMFVREDHRGRSGLASLLMETLVAWSKRSGYRTILLGTTERMTGAHRFYAKHDFTEISPAQLPAFFPLMPVDTRFFRRDLRGVVSIREYNPRWPELFDAERLRIREALGATAIAIEHTGSTAVPDLPAKPIIDITLTVPDTTDEDAYVPLLEAAGYRFFLREPEWFEHRLLIRDWPRVNLHVFSVGCGEVDRMLAFRDWLRSNRADRELYARVKRSLADREWSNVQDYADAKTDVVSEIMSRAVHEAISHSSGQDE
jgi:GrpB-like predicted nucleotidyltransferase (UPF0157 family)/GNAT superfamily N-acetyltransferase